VVRRPTVVTLTYGGEPKTCKAPVLKMTSIGKCPLKITGKKYGLRSFWILGHKIWGLTLYMLYL
jgi:hypothetical protein